MKWLTKSVLSFLVVTEATDMDIRFSKVEFVDNFLGEDEFHPLLTSFHYPITIETFDWLRFTTASSIVIPETCTGCDDNTSFEDLVEVLGGPPPHPSRYSRDFWDMLHHVVQIQLKRRNGVDPITIMPLPDLWMDFTIEEVAEAVHDEYPGIHHVAWIQNEGKNLTVDNNIIPFVCTVEFIRGIVMLSSLNNWAIAEVAQTNFGLKYHVGRARPEEVVWQIVQRQTGYGPTPTLVADIDEMELMDMRSFTAYPEGSPTHPSWPAMHSAGSAASLWMAVVLDLTDEQWCQIKLTDYAISYARIVAGVHYEDDHLAGLALGQEIIAKRLPNYLHEMYGSPVEEIQAKIDEKRVDWAAFLESDCAKRQMMK